MKKLLSVLLVVAMAASLTACSTSDPKGSVTPSTTVTVAENTINTTAATTAAQDEGLSVGGTYTNEAMGITCTLDENWTYYTEDQLLQMSNVVADNLTDEDLAETLKNSKMYYDMVAMRVDGLGSINACIENIGLVYGTLMDENAYIEASLAKLPQALEASGGTDVTCEAGTALFGGEDRPVISITCSISGIQTYERLYVFKSGDYIMSLTFASYGSDTIDDAVSNFQML